MKVLVCGGRDFFDASFIYDHLSQIHKERTITCLVHGCANGADTLAGRWAKANGIEERRYPADWKKYGRTAGKLRNSQMLAEESPDLVIAFPGHGGTYHMCEIAKAAGVPVIKYGYERKAEFFRSLIQATKKEWNA
jgi:hypothetical protein